MRAPERHGSVEVDPIGGSVRKFLFSTSVLSSLFGAVAVIRTTRSGPRDWRLILQWVIWGASVAIAVGTVIERSKDAEDY
jgi:hypothetical protein